MFDISKPPRKIPKKKHLQTMISPFRGRKGEPEWVPPEVQSSDIFVAARQRGGPVMLPVSFCTFRLLHVSDILYELVKKIV